MSIISEIKKSLLSQKKNRDILIKVACISLGILLPILLDVRIERHTALSILLNAGPMLALMLLIWALSGRVWIGLLVQVAVLALVHTASAVKLKYLDIDLIYADTLTLGSVVQNPDIVLGFASTQQWLGLAAGFVFFGIFIYTLRKHVVSHWRIRVVLGVIACACFAGIILVRLPNVIDAVDWDIYRQTRGGLQAGVVGNLVLGKMTTRDVNRTPEPEKIREFELLTGGSAATDHNLPLVTYDSPDIVLIQSESLFDLRKLNNFDLQVLPSVFDADPSQIAELEVPVYGGRTLQTEFEVLSGVPISYYKNSMFIYFEIFNRHMNGLPRHLSRYGYSTIAIHPASRSFWTRDRALPYLGFDAFIDESAFLTSQESTQHGFISDKALMRSVVATLDAATGPTMVNAITINNHGPWGKLDDFPLPDKGIPKLADPTARAQLADYIQRSQAADKSFSYLIQALQARQRKTVVIFYGDHLPALPEVFNATGFRDGAAPQKQTTPIRVWANYTLPPLPRHMPAYLIPGWLMEALGIRDNSHFSAAGTVVRSLSSTTDIDHSRLMDSYAHVAAAGLTSVPAEKTDHVTVVTKDNIDPLITHRTHQNQDYPLPVVNGHSFVFASKKASRQSIRLDVRNINYMVLRVGYDPKDIGCDFGQADQQSYIQIKADNSEIYKARTPGYAFRLIPLNTQQIDELLITHTVEEPDAVCNDLIVKVAQVQCRENCELPAEMAFEPKQHSITRIATDDRLDIERELVMAHEKISASTPTSRLHDLLALVINKKEAFGTFHLINSQRIQMHPGQSDDAWIEFDVSGLSKLTLNGKIETLTAECLNVNPPGKENGLVGLTYSVDSTPESHRVLVGATTAATQGIAIALKDASRLRITVDKGNDVNWCDHFSLGVDSIEY